PIVSPRFVTNLPWRGFWAKSWTRSAPPRKSERGRTSGMLAGTAEFERELIKARTGKTCARARPRGCPHGAVGRHQRYANRNALSQPDETNERPEIVAA